MGFRAWYAIKYTTFILKCKLGDDMTQKWERRDEKRRKRHKMAVHGKGLLRTENDREHRREKRVGVGTEFFDGVLLLTVIRKVSRKTWLADDGRQFDTAYILKNSI